MSKNFAVLCYADHIWSKIIINDLVKANLIPKFVLEEDSKFSNQKKNFYDKLVGDMPDKSVMIPSKSLINNINSKLSDNNQILYHCVKSHNNQESLEFIKSNPVDIILLANTGIIKSEIYSQARIGSFNCHPDKLPGYRGSVVFLRKILQELPLGVTCHWVNDVLDTGNIAFYQDININDQDSLENIVYNIINTSSTLFKRILTEEKIPSIIQDLTGDYPCFKFPENEELIIQECKTILKNKAKL